MGRVDSQVGRVINKSAVVDAQVGSGSSKIRFSSPWDYRAVFLMGTPRMGIRVWDEGQAADARAGGVRKAALERERGGSEEVIEGG